MTNVIEKVMLVKVSSADNNNKFYEAQLTSDGSVLKRWGRVGADGQSSNDRSGKNGFDKIVKAKKSKGYKEVKVVGNATNSSLPTQDREEVRKASRQGLAKHKDDQAIITLIDRLVEKNKHEILEASGGLIQVSSSGVIETALGIIEPSSLKTAETILAKLEASKNVTANYKSLLEEYLTLVPQKVPHARGWEKDFFKENPITKQRSLLQQLEQSYDWYQNEQKALEDAKDKTADEKEVDYSDYFAYKLSSLPQSREGDATFKYIDKMFKKSRSKMHVTYNKKLKKVYVLEERGGDEVFNNLAKEMGNVKELFHGTTVVNLLSILRKRLFSATAKDGVQISGKLLGPGIYQSLNSTKGLNYSDGRTWGNAKHSDCFMFLSESVCGKEFFPKHYNDWPQAHKGGYNSICAKGGSFVKNHEQVIWNTDQIKLRYLLEFTD